MADCGKEKFSAHPKTEMKMADYLSYWADLMKEKDQVERGDSSRKLLYLKDWHLARCVSTSAYSMRVSPFNYNQIHIYIRNCGAKNDLYQGLIEPRKALACTFSTLM